MTAKASAWLTALIVVLASCAHSPVAGTTPSEPTPGNVLIAQRLPRVEYLGGPFLRHPRVVTITVAGDDAALVSRLERFGEAVTRSGWWREVTDGYCVRPGDCIGQGRPAHAAQLVEPLPDRVSDADVADLLAAAAGAGTFGELDSDTILLFYLPDGVNFIDAVSGRYCDDGPRALHSALDVNDTRIAYAVVPRCGDAADLTASASHEILEATTNPDPARRGFAFRGGAASGAFTAAGVEPADVCGLIAPDGRVVVDGGFAVQRAWSNRAAALGHDPCVPAPEGPYRALIPREPAIRLSTIDATATLALDATADRATPNWRIIAVDLTATHGKPRCVEARLDQSTVDTGDTVGLTVTLRHPPPRDVCTLGLVSSRNGTDNIWPVTISVTPGPPTAATASQP